MAEHDQLLESIGKLIEPLRVQLNEQGEAIKNLDVKVEAFHEFQKKAHAETMKILLDTGEANYKELKKELEALKKRVEQLETHERTVHPHNN